MVYVIMFVIFKEVYKGGGVVIIIIFFKWCKILNMFIYLNVWIKVWKKIRWKNILEIFLLKNNSGFLLGDIIDKKRYYFIIFGVCKSYISL